MTRQAVSSLAYRSAAVLLVIFALGHQFGFRSVDPTWGADALARAMQTTSFAVQGFTRTFWDFYSGFGFLVTIFLLFSAVLSWELSRMPDVTRGALARTRWAFAICYVAVAIITWASFFVAPGTFATLIAVGLIIGASKS